MNVVTKMIEGINVVNVTKLIYVWNIYVNIMMQYTKINVWLVLMINVRQDLLSVQLWLPMSKNTVKTLCHQVIRWYTVDEKKPDWDILQMSVRVSMYHVQFFEILGRSKQGLMHKLDLLAHYASRTCAILYLYLHYPYPEPWVSQNINHLHKALFSPPLQFLIS